MFICIILSAFICPVHVFSQGLLVTVDEKEMDDNLIQSIKQLQPDFGLLGDSTLVVSKVLKFYTYRKYLTQLAREQSLDTLTELSTKLAVAKKTLEERMIAEYYGEYITNKIAVSEAEAKQYYETDKLHYSTPGKCDVIYIETSDTSKKLITELKKIGEENAILPAEQRMNLKKYNDIYLIKNYQIYSNTEHYPFLKELFSAKPKAWIGPFFYKDISRYVYFLIIKKEMETFTPYESVKDMCIQNLRSIKYSLLVEQLNAEALKKYPIRVKVPIVTEKNSVKLFYH